MFCDSYVSYFLINLNHMVKEYVWYYEIYELASLEVTRVMDELRLESEKIVRILLSPNLKKSLMYSPRFVNLTLYPSVSIRSQTFITFHFILVNSFRLNKHFI